MGNAGPAEPGTPIGFALLEAQAKSELQPTRVEL
jgi:hypothetical protein